MSKCIIAAAVVISMIFLMPALAIADDDMPSLPPPAPWETGGSGGGGGGGGGGGSYTPPVFEKYTINLTSSDGSPIGSVDVKDYSLATLQASKNLSCGNDSVVVGLLTDLSSAPTSINLDILPVDTMNAGLPIDPDRFSSLLAFNITRYGSWAMKDGTVHLTLNVPVNLLSSMDGNSQYYLVKDDGTCIIMYSATLSLSGGMALFDIPLLYEAGSPSSGIFTLVGPKSAAASTSTSPTPAPATPTPKSGSYVSILGLVAAMAIVAIFYSRSRK